MPEAHLDFQRQVDKADYADLVTVANLQNYVGSDHPMAAVDWRTVAAFARLDLPVLAGEQHQAYRQQVEQMQAVLRS